jgi:hypothetical protein
MFAGPVLRPGHVHLLFLTMPLPCTMVRNVMTLLNCAYHSSLILLHYTPLPAVH